MSKIKLNKFLKFFTLTGFFLSFIFFSANAQTNVIINGKVIESRTKTPLSGASISLSGSTNVVTTNNKGEFKFSTYHQLPFVLVVSFIGYQTQEIHVDNTDFVNVSLVESPNQLSDVVVVGYGTQRRKDVTGSIASVPKENFNRPSPSFDNILQGSISGVVVTQSSGQPGATSDIRIRGGNSLSFGNDPLYVIDGFIYYNNNNLTNLSPSGGQSVTGVTVNGLATINPNDIESIDVLKDASATAIYGARGANGVIIVTTKRGTRGSNNVNYSGSYGVTENGPTAPVLNGPQWASLFDDLYKATPTIQAGLASDKHIIDSLGAAGVSQNWVTAALKPGAISNQSLSIYGGDEKSRYSISGNYFNQAGDVINTGFTRYSARINYEKNVSNKFKVTTGIFGSNSVENELTGTAYNSIQTGNAFSSLFSANPLQLEKNPDGSYKTTYDPALNTTVNTLNNGATSTTDNPIQDIASTLNETNVTRLMGNFAAEYKLLNDLTIKATFGTDVLNTKLDFYAPSYTTLGNNSGTSTGEGSVGNINYLAWLNENTVTYDHTFNNKHFLTLLAGYTTQYEKSENTFLYGQSFPTDALTYNNLYLATANKVIGSGEGKETFNSWLGRVNYSFEHRYNVTLSGRVDGASPTGADHKWGFFPSAGFSWNASDEDFFKKFDKTISNLKVRLSAGSVGNANFPPYSSLSTINSYGYYFGSPLTGASGLGPTQPANPDLTWETTTQYDAGIDLGVLKNRINLTADVYYKKTTNLYISGGGLIPLSTGYATISENIGSLQNEGVELALNTENIKTHDFTWNSTLIYATNANKVLSLGPSQSFQPAAPTGQVSPVIIKVGLPVGTFWGYKTDGLLTTADLYGPNPVPTLSGVSQQTGDRRYLHAPGVTGPTISSADKQNLGSAQPIFTGSFNNTFKYKDFDLTFFFQGSYGNKIFNLLFQDLMKTTTTGNASAVLLNRFDSLKNPHGTVPKVTNAPVMQVEDTYIQNGSYLRLKNITLGYNLPAKIASKILAKQIRVYISAQNLFTITKYPGLDPEANFYDQNNLQPGVDEGIFPYIKTYTAGVNVTF